MSVHANSRGIQWSGSSHFHTDTESYLAPIAATDPRPHEGEFPVIASVYYCVLPVVVLVALGRHDDPKWLLRFVVSWCACCLVRIKSIAHEARAHECTACSSNCSACTDQLDSPAARVLHRTTPGMAAWPGDTASAYRMDHGQPCTMSNEVVLHRHLRVKRSRWSSNGTSVIHQRSSLMQRGEIMSTSVRHNGSPSLMRRARICSAKFPRAGSRIMKLEPHE